MLRILILFFCVNYIFVTETQMLRKEAYSSVPQLISSAGYPNERHRTKTEDGYILQMHRITAGRRTARKTDSAEAKGKKAVLIVHGLFGSSGDFVIMGPERSLAYILADSGYDVWLGNLRGNIYSSHENLTKNNPDFWEFSFHEHGKYDVPALIDKVLSVTGLPKLMYIGYSMGTTSFFTMLSQKPEYNNKMIAFVALAPAVYMDNVRQYAEFFLKTFNFPKTLRSRGLLSLSLRTDVMDVLIGTVCNVRQPEEDMCLRILYALVGEDYDQTDWDMAPVTLARFQSASWRQIEHFGKIALTGVFTSWEDGLWGAVKPYDLSNVKVPVTLLYGENDQLTEKSQIMRLANTLNSTGVLEAVRPGCKWPKFNHLDFIFAKDVGKLVNKPLVKLINKLLSKYAST